MSGERCLNRYLRGFGVTNFADHDDVRILAQDGAQSPGERHIHPAVYLGLSDAFQLVLDGIFDGQDITLGEFSSARIAYSVVLFPTPSGR